MTFEEKLMSKLYNVNFVEFLCGAKFRPFLLGAVLLNWYFIKKLNVQGFYLVMEGVNMR